MPRLITVYDTNVLRELGTEAFAELRRAERARGVQGMASYYVAMELIAHVASSADPHFNQSWSGIRRLVHHTTTFNGAEHLVHFLADADDQVSFSLFGRSREDSEGPPQLYGTILGRIANAKVPGDWAQFDRTIGGVAERVRTAQSSFRDSLWRNVVQRLVPDAESWRAIAERPELRSRLLAAMNPELTDEWAAGRMVAQAARQLGLQLSEDERAEKVATALRIFAAPIALYRSVIRRIFADGYNLDLERNVNSLWDVQIAHSTSVQAKILECPVWLITSDRAILSAAVEVGAQRVIRSLSSYRELLSGHGDELVHEISTVVNSRAHG